MKKEELKAEAKRLRSAITEMFGIPVSTAQSLELIAKTKNFPNWDAACGSAIRAERTPLAVTEAMPTAKCLEDLGFPDQVLAQIKAMVASTPGLFLVAGSPPSGRSTTLAAVMLEAISAKQKVATLENPIERVISGASQYRADANDWRETLRAIMRSAPDIIMMPDLRNPLSVSVAADSAKAGTQVWAGITSRLPSMDAVSEALNAIDPDGQAAKLVRGVIWQRVTDDGRIEAQILLRPPQDRVERVTDYDDARSGVDMHDARQQRDPLVVTMSEGTLVFMPTSEGQSMLDRLSPQDRRAWAEWCAANPQEHDGMKWPGWSAATMKMLKPAAAVRMNALTNAAENIDWTVRFLVEASGISVPAEVQEAGKKVLAAHAKKGEVTLVDLVDAFDHEPQLREWAAALRKATLPGPLSDLLGDAH